MDRALIFDFDGTIAPSEELVYETWRGFFRARGHDLPLAVWTRCIGGDETHFDPGVYAEERGLGEQGVVRQQLAQAVRERSRQLSVNPGVLELVAAARAAGLPLGIASSSSRSWVEEHLARFGLLASFSSIRTRDDGPVKPSPYLYRCVLEDLAARAEASWAVEDSGPGVRSAKAAGLRVLAVPSAMTADHDLSLADVVVGSLEEISIEALGLAASHPRTECTQD
jgi:HAD superfamily hydrolase (TIGR01509 family)